MHNVRCLSAALVKRTTLMHEDNSDKRDTKLDHQQSHGKICVELFQSIAMDPTNEMFRFYVFTEMRRGKSAKKIFEHLHFVWESKTPSYDTVCRWIRDFQSEKRDSFTDEPRSGRPSSVRTEESAARIKELVEEDHHLSVRELSNQSGISIGSVHSILRQKLLFRNVCSVWVPYHLTEETKRKRVLCATAIAESLTVWKR